jgi:hypothetical protein
MRIALKERRPKHRFLGFYKRTIEGVGCYIYRCICGYTEAVPVAGGPGTPLDHRFKHRSDARNVAIHAHLERGHQVN